MGESEQKGVIEGSSMSSIRHKMYARNASPGKLKVLLEIKEEDDDGTSLSRREKVYTSADSSLSRRKKICTSAASFQPQRVQKENDVLPDIKEEAEEDIVMSSSISKYNLSTSFKPQSVQKENDVLQRQIKEEEDEILIFYDKQLSKHPTSAKPQGVKKCNNVLQRQIKEEEDEILIFYDKQLSKHPTSAKPQGVKKCNNVSLQDGDSVQNKSMPLPTAPKTSSTEGINNNSLCICSVCSKSLTVGGNWQPYKLSHWEKPICSDCTKISLNRVKDHSDEPACPEMSRVCNKDCTNDPNSAEVSPDCNKGHNDDHCYDLFHDPDCVEISLDCNEDQDDNHDFNKDTYLTCSECNNPFKLEGSWRAHKPKYWSKPICFLCSRKSFQLNVRPCITASSIQTNPVQPQKKAAKKNHDNSSYVCSKCKRSFNIEGKEATSKSLKGKKPVCAACTKKASGLKRKSPRTNK